jgi:hypothetical protein
LVATSSVFYFLVAFLVPFRFKMVSVEPVGELPAPNPDSDAAAAASKAKGDPAV